MTVDERTRTEVLATVSGLIAEVIGDEYAVATPISMTTSFSEDLEMESIEFVALAELVHSRYGPSIDVVSWIGDMELVEIMSLTVGQLVEYVVACLT